MREPSLVELSGDNTAAATRSTVAVVRMSPKENSWSSHIARVWIDQPGEVANPARGQLNRENEYFPVCLRSFLRIWSHETRSTVPSRVSLLILQLQAEFDAYSHGIPPDLRGGVLGVFYPLPFE